MTDQSQTLKDKLTQLNQTPKDGAWLDEPLSPVFTDNADDQATIDLYIKRRQMNDVLCDAMRQRDNAAALTIVSLPDFQLDPSRRIDDQDPITYALNNNSDDVVMALLNQPLEIINTLLETTPIIQTVLDKKRSALVKRILDLPKEKYVPMLHLINECWEFDNLENAPYNRFLEEAEWEKVKPTISATSISHLIDKDSQKRLAFYNFNNENLNSPIRRNRENNEIYLKPFPYYYNSKPLSYSVLTGKWRTAIQLLAIKGIDPSATAYKPREFGNPHRPLPDVLKMIAKKNTLPPEAWEFITAFEEKIGAEKPIVKRPKDMRKKQKKLGLG